jgi:RNA polymerase-binding transcription factor DksA
MKSNIDDIGDKYEDEKSSTLAPAPTPATAPLALTFEQLKELLLEAKKPVMSDADKKKLESDQLSRKENAQIIDQERQKKLYEQSVCGHTRRDGSSRTVYVENGNYLICQRCQDVIRPTSMLKDEFGKDTKEIDVKRREMFNKHFAMTNRNQMFDW